MPAHPLHVHRTDGVEGFRPWPNHFSPRHYAGKADRYQKINRGHNHNGNDDAQGDDAFWTFDFIPEIANLVIAQEIEHYQHGSIAQTKQEGQADVPGSGRKIQQKLRIYVSHPGENDPGGGN